MKLYPNLIKLYDYVPDDKVFTSGDEIRHIKDTLKFNEAGNDDLYNYRTLVVSMWTSRYHELKRLKDAKAEDVWQSMMSILAVIDDESANRGIEI